MVLEIESCRRRPSVEAWTGLIREASVEACARGPEEPEEIGEDKPS